MLVAYVLIKIQMESVVPLNEIMNLHTLELCLSMQSMNWDKGSISLYYYQGFFVHRNKMLWWVLKPKESCLYLGI